MVGVYFEVELMSDPAQLARLSARVSADGGLLVCDRCRNPEEIIVALLRINDLEGAWSLCGPCLRDLPQAPIIV
jgi:hypothetical protein